jgi:hypothetical protein
MKLTLLGDAEHEPNQELIVALANEAYSCDILPVLVQQIAKFDFEVRLIFSIGVK